MWAQAPERPRFDVVSVKPNPGCTNNEHIVSPGRLQWSCITVERLIHNAYVTFADGKKLSPSDIEIVGAPGWTSSDTYSLAAKAEGAAALPLMAGPMLQSLLEDRFQLKIRHATKDAPVYALTPAKRGMKLEPSKATCGEPDLRRSSSLEVPANRPDETMCGNVYVNATGANLTMDGHGVAGVVFAKSLSHYVDRPVFDSQR